jgi:hypothetical protein
MDWARVLAYVTGTVDQELLARNEYLAAENRILKAAAERTAQALGRRASHARRDWSSPGPQGPRRRRNCGEDLAVPAGVRVWHFASAPKPKIHVRFWSASHKRATASSGVLPEPMHQVLVADHSWSLSLREERSRNLSGTNANTAAMSSSRVGMNQFSTSAASPRE